VIDEIDPLESCCDLVAVQDIDRSPFEIEIVETEVVDTIKAADIMACGYETSCERASDESGCSCDGDPHGGTIPAAGTSLGKYAGVISLSWVPL